VIDGDSDNESDVEGSINVKIYIGLAYTE